MTDGFVPTLIVPSAAVVMPRRSAMLLLETLAPSLRSELEAAAKKAAEATAKEAAETASPPEEA